MVHKILKFSSLRAIFFIISRLARIRSEKRNEYENEKVEEKALDEIAGGVKFNKKELDDLNFELKIFRRSMF